MTNQEAFDRAVTGILAQDCVSFREHCVYAGPNGSACAVGQLLPRELAEEWDRRFPDGVGISAISALEDTGPYSLCKQDLERLGLTDLQFLSDLQELHDGFWVGWDRNEFIADARQFAADHDLSAAVLPEPVA